MFYILLEIWDMGIEWHIITDTDTRKEMAKYIQDNLEDLQEMQYEDDGYFSIRECNGEYITDIWEGDIKKLLKLIQEDTNE